jgi:N-methylhydantoinase A
VKRLGVDVGGTFTDVILYDETSRQVQIAKEPTTPSAPREGVLRAIVAVLPDGELPTVTNLVHGTTVGLNALLTETGARTGLLTTRGFRDVLEIRLGDRDDAHDLFWRPPPPLVPRRLRLEATERILYNGEVRVPLDLEDVRLAADVFAAEGIKSAAIVFLHSYANPEHELRAADGLRQFGFEGELTLSHEVSGEYREYERTSTTVIDAYVRPKMTAYLRDLESELKRKAFRGDVLITRSGGGAMTVPEAERRPVETILSGPVAGVEGAAALARDLDFDQVITADVGGTSFDTSLITNGQPHLIHQGRIAGLPIQTPWIDVRSIGAGGGSLAYVDVGGLLRVGPASAGAYPGPACYGRGGNEPTVTDAALILGMLGDGRLAGGLRLDGTKAHEALAVIADRLSADVEGAARGVLTIAVASMADAIREITVEEGKDPRDTVLMAFGGAGPVFGVLLARDLDISQVVVPPFAGNFSAYGLLSAERTQAIARTQIIPLRSDAIERATEIVLDLQRKVRGRQEAGNAPADYTVEVAADMRYVGQEYTLTVPLSLSGGELATSCDDLGRVFERSYENTFGHAIDEEIEIVVLRATSRAPVAKTLQPRAETNRSSFPPTDGFKYAYSFARQEWLEFLNVHRSALRPQSCLTGPAIIHEDTTTTYLDAGWTCRPDDSGALLLDFSRETVNLH